MNTQLNWKSKELSFFPIKIDNKGTNLVRDLQLIFNFYTIYKKITPDVILHFTIKPNIYGSMAAGILKIPVVNNITGLGTVFLKDNILQFISTIMYKIAFLNVKKVFFQNTYDKNLFIQKNIVTETNVDILPGSGVDTKKFSPMNKTRSSTQIIFLLIARVIRDKGIIEYVEAAKKIKKNYNNVEFQILGQLGVINRSAIKKEEVDLWHHMNLVNYLGTNDDVRGYIANADCVVLPSYREGTSKTLLEAASMAKPIIATNVPGCNNIVSHFENGLLCEVKNSRDLAEKMEYMLKLPLSEREKMGKKGRNKMIASFEETIVIDKYLKEIESIVVF